jgi:hypothetical protein
MNIAEYKDWLESRIKVLGTELESLVIARKVLLSAESFLNLPDPAKPRIKKASRQPGPMAAQIRTKIIEVVKESNTPVQSKVIVDKVCGTEFTAVEQKRVWNQIYNLAKAGKIQKLGVGTYGRGVNG